MASVAAHLESLQLDIQEYQLSNTFIDGLKDFSNYPDNTLLIVNHKSEIMRENRGANVRLTFRPDLYCIAVQIKFKKELMDHVTLLRADKQLDEHGNSRTVLIDKKKAHGVISPWIDISTMLRKGVEYMLSIPNANNVATVIVKYGIICKELDKNVSQLAIKYDLDNYQYNDLLMENYDSLLFAASKDYVDMFTYLFPRVTKGSSYPTEHCLRSSLTIAVRYNAINMCRHLLDNNTFTNVDIDAAAQIAMETRNTGILSLLILHKSRQSTKTEFNLNLRDGLMP